MQINGLDNKISYNIENTGNTNHEVSDIQQKQNIDGTKRTEDRCDCKKEYSEDEIINAIEDANEEFVVYDRRFEFSIHEKTKQITIKIFDTVTDEIIREVPPEKILDTIAGIWEVAGILVDERV